MQKEVTKWYSPRLNKDMDIAIYGHYGLPILLFPTAGADFLEYERFGLLDTIEDMVNSGRFKIYSINSVNAESWMNREMQPHHKALRHQSYNYYVKDEVVPFIHHTCKGLVPIVTAGASLGAFHALNLFFRHPDVFYGTLAMSGVYDLKEYTRGYYDENVYFNSPMDYLSGLNDDWALSKMRHNKKIVIATGQGEFEDPQANRNFSNLLNYKQIPHVLDLWGYDMRHDWPTWYKMLPYLLSTHF